MTPLQQSLDKNVFQNIKQEFINQIKSKNKKEIVDDTENVIKQIQEKNIYSPIEVEWESLKVSEQTSDFFNVDNFLVEQGYLPNERIRGNIFQFSATIKRGDDRLLKYVEQKTTRNKQSLYNLSLNGKTMLFSIVIFGDPNDAQKVIYKRDEVKEVLIKTFDKINYETNEFKKTIDELIAIEVYLKKKLYTDSDNFFDKINKIK